MHNERPELSAETTETEVLIRHQNGNVIFRRPLANSRKEMLAFVDALDKWIVKYDAGNIDVSKGV